VNIKDVKTCKDAVEFTVYKYSTVARRALVDDCGFCEAIAKRGTRAWCFDCPVHLPEARGCDNFWNRYLKRARVHEIFAAVLAKVNVFSARNIRAALIKELKSRERERFLGE